MDEQKIPKQVRWVGAIVAITVAVMRYLYTPKKKTKKNIKEEKEKNSSSGYKDVNLSGQFDLRCGETAYIDAEGLKILFSKVILEQNEAPSGSRRRDPPAIVVLEMTEQVGIATESCTLELSTSNYQGRPRVVLTEDQLIGQYDVRLNGLEFPKTPGINEYVANLVIFKVKQS
ncbi:MAG: hypothetical protein HY225_02215 [Candidatus Vogelbacteria bacterium]|nr:hypothetical protein [Candidatus Vogelbacteria bacterium]